MVLFVCLLICFLFMFLFFVFVFCLLFLLLLLFSQDMVSLCSPGYPGALSVDQAGLELRNPPASASQVLGLKVSGTTLGSVVTFSCSVSLPTV